MIAENLKKFVYEKKATLLGVGPMSVNCVDAAIELANEFSFPLMLIASRRQIDSEDFGGGYVNNWTTFEFASYVRSKDIGRHVYLARDHGGPWQNEQEQKKMLDLESAMGSAKASFLSDIEAGFDMLHIDPSIDVHHPVTSSQIMDRAFELYDYCWSEVTARNYDVAFEVGTEEQIETSNSIGQIESTLAGVDEFCKNSKIPTPLFVVLQTGTKVMEMKNTGVFDEPVRPVSELPSQILIPKAVEICERYGVMLKQHNTDYLSDTALKWHPRLGIHSVNVAPEFGVAESKAFMEVLEQNALVNEKDLFIQLAVESGKWNKWMLKNSSSGDYEKALISGHYIFSSLAFRELYEKVEMTIARRGDDLTRILKDAVKLSITRYARNLRLMV